MKSALSDFILGKKGIYGILHIIILLMSLFLVISISIDTFKGIPFYTQSSYMKIQLWICLWFLFDFVLEFFLVNGVIYGRTLSFCWWQSLTRTLLPIMGGHSLRRSLICFGSFLCCGEDMHLLS